MINIPQMGNNEILISHEMDLLIFLHCVCDNCELVIRSQLTTKERSVEYDILKKDYYSLETKILSTRSEMSEGPKIWERETIKVQVF